MRVAELQGDSVQVVKYVVSGQPVLLQTFPARILRQKQLDILISPLQELHTTLITDKKESENNLSLRENKSHKTATNNRQDFQSVQTNTMLDNVINSNKALAEKMSEEYIEILNTSEGGRASNSIGTESHHPQPHFTYFVVRPVGPDIVQNLVLYGSQYEKDILHNKALPNQKTDMRKADGKPDAWLSHSITTLGTGLEK